MCGKNNTLNKFENITENGQVKTGQIVSKAFVNKGGVVKESEDLYLRYPYKIISLNFCESEVNIEEIKPYIKRE